MAGVNKVILIGYVGADPEVRHMEAGLSVASFRLATTEFYKDKNGNRVEQVEWHSVVCWRALAEITEKYVKKGSQVYVEGRIRTRQYEDREKHKRTITEIYADTINLLGAKHNSNEPKPQNFTPQANNPSKTEDLPF